MDEQGDLDSVVGVKLAKNGRDVGFDGRDTEKDLSQAMPRGRLRMLPGQTHAVNPGVLAPILAEFFGSY